MPIFKKEDLFILFAHIPKTGGTTIEQSFMNDGWVRHFHDNGAEKDSVFRSLNCSPQHWHGNILENICNIDKISYSFTIIRHPVERMKSEYRWRKNNFGAKGDATTWISKALDSYSDNKFTYDNHIRPQVEFPINGMRVFNLENRLETVINNIKHNITESKLEIPKERRAASTGHGEVDSISDDLSAHILDFYKEDMKLWEEIQSRDEKYVDFSK